MSSAAKGTQMRFSSQAGRIRAQRSRKERARVRPESVRLISVCTGLSTLVKVSQNTSSLLTNEDVPPDVCDLASTSVVTLHGRPLPNGTSHRTVSTLSYSRGKRLKRALCCRLGSINGINEKLDPK